MRRLQFLVVFSFLFFVAITVIAQKEERSAAKKAVSSAAHTFLNINNISTWIYNNGQSDISSDGDCGFVYPKGSGKTAFYDSGFLWGGYIDGYWTVGGTSYRTGLQQGRILSDGTAEDASSARIYRVRSDYKNYKTDNGMDSLFASEIADEGKTAEEIYAQYQLDWQQWPAQYGAPFVDYDGDGVYNPDIDTPGVSTEPCQTVWFAANDLDESLAADFYGSLPMKIELQATLYAFEGTGAFGNTIFRKYKIINKNTKQFDSMYVCMWSDPDVGAAFDDFVGCDTTLSLGYAYNGDLTDQQYGSAPPAGGFVMLQTPYVLGSSSDSARVNGKYVHGYKNLGMTGFYLGLKSVADFGDPFSSVYESGALKVKNLFQSKLLVSGTPIIDPVTNKATKFPVSGDPIALTGWYDGITYAQSDRRMGLISGQFNMNPGDTQEVVIAQSAAGSKGQVDYLEAVKILKAYANSLKMTWEYGTIPYPPGPHVTASEMDRKIILNWSDSSTVAVCEKNRIGLYKFQGYNVYQFPSAVSSLSEGTRLATYDIEDGLRLVSGWVENASTGYLEYVVVGYGSDSGLKRYFTVETDMLNSGSKLYNYSKYYFGVTAYYAAEDNAVIPRIIESPLTIVTAMPHSDDPGERLTTSIGDTLAYTHSAGQSEGEILLEVIDPLKGDGNTYTVTFNDSLHYNIFKNSNVLYSNLTVEGVSDANPIVAGVQVHITAPSAVYKEFTAEDVYSFTVPEATTSSVELAKADADKVNVFPNPYYAVNSQETDSFRKFVTFTHLPQRVKIKIFNISGQLVRTLEKDSDSQVLKWNFATDNNWYVSSGVYVAYIEMPDIGKIKTLKFSVILEQAYPVHY